MIFNALNENGLTFRIHYQNIPATLFLTTPRKIKNMVNFHSYVRGEVLKEEKEDNSNKEEEELMTKANKPTEKITSRPDKPKPAILQAQEFMVYAVGAGSFALQLDVIGIDEAQLVEDLYDFYSGARLLIVLDDVAMKPNF